MALSLAYRLQFGSENERHLQKKRGLITIFSFIFTRARVVELVDTLVSGASA